MGLTLNPLTGQFDITGGSSSGGGTWGSITGTLSSQTDLQAALDAKLDDSQLDTDNTLAANSDTKIASQKAIKTYADAKVAKSTLTTKGDIFVATGASTVVRQAVGANGEVIIADSAQTNGIKWGAVPSDPLLGIILKQQYK